MFFFSSFLDPWNEYWLLSRTYRQDRDVFILHTRFIYFLLYVLVSVNGRPTSSSPSKPKEKQNVFSLVHEIAPNPDPHWFCSLHAGNCVHMKEDATGWLWEKMLRSLELARLIHTCLDIVILKRLYIFDYTFKTSLRLLFQC